MNDLTKLWQKGELPEETKCYVRVNGGIYLGSIRYKNGCHNKKLPYVKSFNGQFITKHIEEILAEVPTFEEWRASEKYIKHLEEVIKIYERKDKQATETSIAYNELAKENEELKEILERHKKATAKAQIRSCDLEIINAQLKELLKECREVIKNVDTYYGNYDAANGYLVINKIDEALQ